MVQATGSNAGKSLFVAGLARVLRRRGLRVAPFKPQNMANNAAVTLDGGEIARAQALQCIACGCEPSSDMNPVLLKPQHDGSSQLIVQGRVVGSVNAGDYPQMRARLLDKVRASYRRLAEIYDVILVEGAGSPAEVNLRAGDIANMGFATAEQIPVLLLADIERGGSIAALCGTHQLLDEQERALVRGYLINKFRGDVALFDGAIDVLTARTGWRNAGVIGWCGRLDELPAEDSLGIKRGSLENFSKKNNESICRVVALRCPYLANADDLDPLMLDDNFAVCLLEAGAPIPADTDVVLLMGSKSVLADLAFLREQGWDIDLLAHRRRGGVIFGICGGYQMLGLSIEDARGLEGVAGKKRGLGLLAVNTRISEGKRLLRARGVAKLGAAKLGAAKLGAESLGVANTAVGDGVAAVRVEGYEMHNGETVIGRVSRSAATSSVRSWLSLRGASDGDEDISSGAISLDGYVLGCYLHGIFGSMDFRRAFYEYTSGLGEWGDGVDYAERIEEVLDIWADHLVDCCDIDFILAVLDRGVGASEDARGGVELIG